MRHAKVARHREPRLYVESRLAPDGTVELAIGQAHYLRSVLRLDRDAAVAGFNASDGEWLCRVTQIGKSGGRLVVERQLRLPEPEPDLWLLFAPIKRTRLDWLIEKATELGISALLPILTARTQYERLNLERLRAHAVAAAEQSERLSVPDLRLPAHLNNVLATWPPERHLAVCDETGAGAPISEASLQLSGRPLAFLIGPEGGFDQTELDGLGKLSFVTRIGLGPRVLRAETAAVAALAVFQAIAGDWRRTRAR
jgi:16S rRNA (uracil1498-N3)-methyltransferase